MISCSQHLGHDRAFHVAVAGRPKATLPESNPVIGAAQRAMRPFLAVFFAALVDANILTYDTLPVNSAGTWFGSGPMSLS